MYNTNTPQHNTPALVSAPNNTPAEVLDISPEALEVANYYLQCQDIDKTAEDLDISRELVSGILKRREVKSYIDHVFMNVGFNNSFKMRAALDAILAQKFREMDEAGIGSSKDITEIMTLSHKFTMDHLAAQIKLEEIREKNALKSQVNVQINDASTNGSNYGSLIERLISNNV